MQPPFVPPANQLRRQFDLRARRGIGQHFLDNAKILKRIVRCAEIENTTTVIEIGMGPGYLTAQLLGAAPKRLIALEMDERFIPIHQRFFNNIQALQIEYGDALKMDFTKLLQDNDDAKDQVIIGNIPYQITSPLLFKIWESGISARKVVFMMQKEVAERMISKPGKSEGVLSLKTSYFCEAKIEFEVDRKSFLPPPRVDSAVVSLQPHTTLKYQSDQQKKFFSLINGAFSQKRKTIVNSLTNSPPFPIEKAILLDALEKCAIDPQIRAEKLNLEKFHQLFQELQIPN